MFYVRACTHARTPALTRTHAHTHFPLIFKMLCELAMPNSAEYFFKKGKEWQACTLPLGADQL